MSPFYIAMDAKELAIVRRLILKHEGCADAKPITNTTKYLVCNQDPADCGQIGHGHSRFDQIVTPESGMTL